MRQQGQLEAALEARRVRKPIGTAQAPADHRQLHHIEMARQKMPLEMCKQLGMKPGSTYAQAVARAQFIKAMKGEVRNASEIREAIEGNATQRVKHEIVDKPLTLEELLEKSYRDE